MRRLRVSDAVAAVRPKARKKPNREQFLIKRLKSCLGYTPKNISLYALSLVHKSAAVEYAGCNERLEYLGDAILNTIISEYLYFRFPDRDEGFLTQTRSKVVSRSSLNALAQKTGLCSWVKIRSPKGSGNNRNVPGDMMEALIGAIYLDRGYAVCRKVIINKLLASVDWEELEFIELDYKSRIIERCQKMHAIVAFQTEQQSESAQAPKFVSTLLVDGKPIGLGQGASKKEAEQAAAYEAWTKART